MIERSAPLPMHIDTHIGACYTNGLESLAASELLFTASKIRTLRLSGYPADILSVLDRIRSPSLESLDLYARDSRQPVDLPEALFGGKAPHLRYLKFENFACIRAPRWLLANITHFTTNASVQMHDLLSELQSMPQLEVLCIMHDSSPRGVTDPPEQLPLPRVALPRLSLFSIRSFISEKSPPHRLVTLPSHIDAPLTVRRHLFLQAFIMRDWDYWASTFTAMQALVPHDSAPGVDDGGLRVAHVKGGPEHGSFEAWSRTGSESASGAARKDALFLFHVDWSRPSYGWPIGPLPNYHIPFFLLAGLCSHLGTTRIEDLAVAPETTIPIAHVAHVASLLLGGPSPAASAGESATDGPDGPDVAAQWQALLAALPSVKTLRLHSGSPACLSVLRALSASADTLLPYLERVFVVRCAVHYATGSAGFPDDIGVAGACSRSVVASREFVQENVGTELVEAVSGRSGLEVVLVGCEVDGKALEALRKQTRVVIGDEQAYV